MHSALKFTEDRSALGPPGRRELLHKQVDFTQQPLPIYGLEL